MCCSKAAAKTNQQKTNRMEEPAETHRFLLQLYGALLCVEYVLTHFTHLWGYTFALILLLLRMHHGDRVPAAISTLLLWIGVSYARTGPTYDGVCMVHLDRLYEPIAAAAHYGVALALVALKIPDSTYLNAKAAYAYLLLLLVPQEHSLFTCMPMYAIPIDHTHTLYLPPAIFLFRLAAFSALACTREFRLAAVCLTLNAYVLLAFLAFLVLYHAREMREFAAAQWESHPDLVAWAHKWRTKIVAVALRDEREDDAD